MQKPRNVKDYFLNDVLVWEHPTRTYRVLDIRIVALREVYAAIEWIDNETGEREVFAFVSLISFSRSRYEGFCHKDMTEHAGPHVSRCPVSILDLLTPTDSEYALAWRERCRKYAAIPPLYVIEVDGKRVSSGRSWREASPRARKAVERFGKSVILTRTTDGRQWEYSDARLGVGRSWLADPIHIREVQTA